MRFRLLVFLALLLAVIFTAVPALGQSTTVSGTITDAGAQAWINGTYRIEFYQGSANPPFYWNGAPFPNPPVFTGNLDGTGSFAGLSIPSNNFINPPGSQWKFTVCPAASAPCFTQAVGISGASQSVSASIIPPAIQVQASFYNQPTAYADSEIQGAIPGFVYFNLVSNVLRQCNNPLPCVWQNAGGGGAITSVFGRTGVVVAQNGDYTCSLVTNCTSNGVTTFNGRNGAVVPQSGDYTASQVTGSYGPIFNALTYGAVGDGSTDNCTAFVNWTAAVNTYTQHPSNAQGFTDLPTAYLPPGNYKWTNGCTNGSTAMTFTSPMILRCEQGAVLSPTGTGNANGHAMEWGPTNLTGNNYQSTYYSIGCAYTGGGSLTSHGIYVNSFVLHPRFWDNKLFNFAGTGTSPVTWSLAFADHVDDPDVERNYWFNDDNIVHNGFAVLSGNGSATNILRAINNFMISAMPPGTTNSNGGHAAANAGIGILSDGQNSTLINNEINWYQPDIRLGSNSRATKILGGTNWEASQTASVGVVQFGDATGGNCVACAIDGLLFNGVQADGHNSTPGTTTNSFLQPTTSSSLLTNASLANVTVFNISATQPVVTLNNTAGQIGNTYQNIQTATGYGAVSPSTLVQNTGTNLSDPFKGFTGEGDSAGNPTYGMSCANSGTTGSTGSCYFRVVNHSAFAAPNALSRVIMDGTNDTQAYPNRGGFVQHTGGAGGGTKIGDWEALDVQVLTAPTAGNLGLHTTFLHQGGIEDTGTTFTASGCGATTLTGGAAVGSYKSVTAGSCTTTITFGSTAAHGWVCDFHDITTAANASNITLGTGGTTTTAQAVEGTVTANDIIAFKCVAY